MRRLALICLLSLAGCNCTFDENLGNTDSGACTKDTDCAGSAICVNQACVQPDAGPSSDGGGHDGGGIDAGWDGGAQDSGAPDAGGSDGGGPVDGGSDAGGFVFDAGCDPLDGGCGYDGGVGSFCALLGRLGCGREAQCSFLQLAQWNECTAFVERWCLDQWDPSAGGAVSAAPAGVATCLSNTLNTDCREERAVDPWASYGYLPGALCYQLFPSGAGASSACASCDGGYCPYAPGACVACTPWLDAGAACDGVVTRCDPNARCVQGVCVPASADGVPCAADSECLSLHCNTTLDAGSRFCGWLPLGASCGLSADCPPGAYCDLGGHCAPLVALGAACDPALDLGYTCDAGFCRDGVCKSVGALPLGAECMQRGVSGRLECAPSLYCAPASGVPPELGRCAPRLGLNAPLCGYDADCQPGLACDVNARCNPYPTVGQPCDHSSSSRHCSEMLECLDTPDGGLCEPYHAVGSNCADSRGAQRSRRRRDLPRRHRRGGLLSSDRRGVLVSHRGPGTRRAKLHSGRALRHLPLAPLPRCRRRARSLRRPARHLRASVPLAFQ
ncbi:MAG: hypothetical protein QM723_37890 [Myxococcaceae bacterium]